jgi:hypothetical protein
MCSLLSARKNKEQYLFSSGKTSASGDDPLKNDTLERSCFLLYALLLGQNQATRCVGGS